MTSYTTHYNIPIPDFTADPWAADYEQAFAIVDAVLYSLTGVSGLLGAWAVSTAYVVLDRVVDTTTGVVWQCAVAHTSASSGTFAADRTANPTYWVTFGYDLQDPGFGFVFSTTTTDADPGAGVVRFNHATLGSVTKLFIDNVDELGVSVAGWLDSFDDVANAGVRGVIKIEEQSVLTNWVLFNVTGAVTDKTGYREIIVEHRTGAAAFGDTANIRVMFVPAGADGTGDMEASIYDPGAIAGDVFDTDNHIDGAVNAVYTLSERSKLSGIEALADVTDAANVATALGNGVEALTTAEVDQLENIGATTISAAQWGYLGGAGAYAATLLTPADEAAFKAAVNLEAGTDFYSISAADAAFEAADADILKADVGDQLAAGYTSDDFAHGTISSGTVTPAPATSQENFQTLTANGAFTLAPPANSCSVIIHVTNGASAGAITVSGYTLVDGDTYATTNALEWLFYITKINDVSHLTVVALP